METLVSVQSSLLSTLSKTKGLVKMNQVANYAEQTETIVKFLKEGNYSYKNIIQFIAEEKLDEAEREELLRFAIVQVVWFINHKLSKENIYTAGFLAAKLAALSVDKDNVWTSEELLNQLTAVSDHLLNTTEAITDYQMKQLDNITISNQLDNNRTSFPINNRYVRFLKAS